MACSLSREQAIIDAAQPVAMIVGCPGAPDESPGDIVNVQTSPACGDGAGPMVAPLPVQSAPEKLTLVKFSGLSSRPGYL
jgi:hypothetical protein